MGLGEESQLELSSVSIFERPQESLDKQLRTPDGDVLNWLVVNLNHEESSNSVTVDDIKVWYENKRPKHMRALAEAQPGRQEAPETVAPAAKAGERKALIPNTTKPPSPSSSGW